MYIKPQALFSLIIYFSVLKRRKTLNIQIVFFFAATRPGGGRTHDPDTTGTSPVIKLKCQEPVGKSIFHIKRKKCFQTHYATHGVAKFYSAAVVTRDRRIDS
jgi:hypothetical protein